MENKLFQVTNLIEQLITDNSNEYAIEILELIKNKYLSKNKSATEIINGINSFIKSRSVRLKMQLETDDELDVLEAKIKLDIFDKISNITSIEKEDYSNRLSEILTESETPIETFNDYEFNNIKEKISHLYNKINNVVKDDLVKSYIETFNPTTSKLDDINLYLNLLLVKRMLEFDVMEWQFVNKKQRVTIEDFDTSNKWWDSIMNEVDVAEELKLVKIADKNLGLKFYTKMIRTLTDNYDKSKFSEQDYNLKNVFNDLGTKEEYFINTILNKTENNSMLIVSDDIKELFDINEVSKFTTNDKLIYEGKFKNRDIYTLSKDYKEFTDAVIGINNGKYLVNPTKPLVYLNIIENSLLEKPIIKLFYLCEFEFDMSKTFIINAKEVKYV